MTRPGATAAGGPRRRPWHGPASLAASVAGSLVGAVVVLGAFPVWPVVGATVLAGLVLLAVPRLRQVGTGLLASSLLVPTLGLLLQMVGREVSLSP